MSKTSAKVPVHHLGISQILAYGLLFYAFAPLKPYLAQAANLSEPVILSLVSVAMVLQALAMPVIGKACDQFGALRVMTCGFLVGSLGMFLLGMTGFAFWSFLPSWVYVSGCFCLIAIGLSMSAYEVAFSAAVQFDEAGSRKQISIIAFYGGVASSLSWLSLVPLLSAIGLFGSACAIAALLSLAAYVIHHMAIQQPISGRAEDQKLTPFHWGLLNRTEKRSLLCLAVSGGFEYLLFSATSLLWISWFNAQFDNVALAVFLASLYGPFQVVGRVIEMRAGRRLDARLTGLIAYSLVPLSFLCATVPTIFFAALAMILFGMGHGVLTVTYGFVTNLYFRADIYGRAKGWIAMPRMLGIAIGPSIGGWLFVAHPGHFMFIMMIFSVLSACVFATLLRLRPTNTVHIA